MARGVLGSLRMPIRSILAVLAIASVPACAYPRTAIVGGVAIAGAGGLVLSSAHVRDCSSESASELCGFDQLHDKINQDIGAVVVISGLVLALTGVVGLGNEHARSAAAAPAPAPIAPPAPAAPGSSPRAAVDARWMRTMVRREPVAVPDHRM